MICPYFGATQRTEHMQSNNYNEDGSVFKYSEITVTKFDPYPCPGAECGAWRDGACHYQQ